MELFVYSLTCKRPHHAGIWESDIALKNTIKSEYLTLEPYSDLFFPFLNLSPLFPIIVFYHKRPLNYLFPWGIYDQ